MGKEQKISDAQLLLSLQTEPAWNPNYRRDRGLFGMHSYDFHLDINIPKIAQELIERKGFFKWYDMCCGAFKAGRELMTYGSKGLDLSKIEAKGIDLITESAEDQVLHEGSLIISNGNVVSYPLPKDIDLITEVEGLYLVNEYMGFSAVCRAIENWYNALSVGGMMAMVRSTYLYGYARPLSIIEFLRKRPQDMQIVEQLRQEDEHVDFHHYVKVTKLTPAKLEFPPAEDRDCKIKMDPNDPWVRAFLRVVD